MTSKVQAFFSANNKHSLPHAHVLNVCMRMRSHIYGSNVPCSRCASDGASLFNSHTAQGHKTSNHTFPENARKPIQYIDHDVHEETPPSRQELLCAQMYGKISKYSVSARPRPILAQRIRVMQRIKNATSGACACVTHHVCIHIHVYGVCVCVCVCLHTNIDAHVYMYVSSATHAYARCDIQIYCMK
jgi:hypothetical protein